MKRTYAIIAIILITIFITGCASETAGEAFSKFRSKRSTTKSTQDPAITPQETMDGGTAGCQDQTLYNDALRCGFATHSALQQYATDADVDALESRLDALESSMEQYNVDIKYVDSTSGERGQLSASAKCGSGYTLVGGGCSVSCEAPSGNGLTRSAINTASNQFECKALSNLPSGCQISARANCLKVTARDSGVTVNTDLRVKETSQADGNMRGATASCDSGYKLVGGGCSAKAGTGNLCLDSGDGAGIISMGETTSGKFACSFHGATPDGCWYQAQAYCLKLSATKRSRPFSMTTVVASLESSEDDYSGEQSEIGCTEDFKLIGGGCLATDTTCSDTHDDNRRILQESSVQGLVKEHTCERIGSIDGCWYQAQSFCLKVT